MTNARREFQRWKDAPLILQIERAIEQTAIRQLRTVCLILRVIKSSRQKMIAELLIKLVAKPRRPNGESISARH